ncbi:P-loop containing nucleoside triphosphate hydrolase protein [Biscogniauxia mediterranea]|nr:P-loop containing nucleoside triphosphate hydrolase protein [Biscogniauxia mediterranea]
MTVVNEPYVVSDDEFDVVETAPLQPVSDRSTPEMLSRHRSRMGSRRQSRISPSAPYSESAPVDSPVQNPVPMLNESSLDNSYTSASSRNPREAEYESQYEFQSPSQSQSQSGEKGGVLNYTKSMAKRFLGHGDLLIAVMGMTGSGKTTFISKVTGRSDLAIGHSLTSCTRDIQVIETKIDGRTVRFVDTPGFSDTTLSDSEVLQLIADYLATAYKSEIKLSGIIYLHPISDTRVTHHATKNLQMFQKLTGDTNLKNVLLVTSMWDKVAEPQGLAREQELKDKFWKIMLAYGAKSIRHNGTPKSAERIAQMLMKNEPFYLQLQKEMGENNMTLRDTAAGREVMAEISKMKEEHQREIAEMETMMKNSANENKSVIEALKEHYQTLLSDMEKTLKDERRMNEAAVQSLNERIAALEKKGVCAVM